jgi:hypothetical protein
VTGCALELEGLHDSVRRRVAVEDAVEAVGVAFRVGVHIFTRRVELAGDDDHRHAGFCGDLSLAHRRFLSLSLPGTGWRNSSADDPWPGDEDLNVASDSMSAATRSTPFASVWVCRNRAEPSDFF